MLQDLPELFLDLVCDHLSYEDVLALRFTCKGLKAFVDKKQFTTLHLLYKKFWFYHRLFYTYEPVDYPHSLHSDHLAILSSNSFLKKFANLQKMTICKPMFFSDRDPTELDLNDLNCFQMLSHLEICEFPRIKGRLSLQELEITAFQIHNGPSKHSSFELNCPRLRALKIKFFRPVLSQDTDQLETLYYHDDYWESHSDPANILKKGYLKSISSNLQNLSTICFDTNDELLRFFSDLETGSLSVPSLIRIRLEQCYCFPRLDELIRRLEDLKKDPHANHIEFTFNGKPICSPDKLREISSLIRAYEAEAEAYFYSRAGLDSDSDLDSIGSMDSDSLRFDISSLEDSSLQFLNETPKLEFLLSTASQLQLYEEIELNEEMIKKLKNIRSLTLSSQLSESTIELLVRALKSIDILFLMKQTLTERLLEMLSNHMNNLEKLEIIECKYETLRPLAKFRNLWIVELDFYPLSDELNFIYENSQSLEIVSIKFYETYLERTTISPKILRLGMVNKFLHEFKTLQSMIDYYEGSCEKTPKFNGSTRIDPLVN